MPKRAILYIAAVVCTGAATLFLAAFNWQMHDPYLFCGLLILAVLLSTMKISLPRMTGTMSAGFVPMLAGISLLTSGETVIIACVSGIVQCMWRARVRPSLTQIAFNGAALSISALAAYQMAHWSWTGVVHANAVSILGVAAATDYIIDSLLVSGVLCLIEGKSLLGVFRNCNFWALPYYFIGVAVVSSVVSIGFDPAWRVVIPTLPIMWAVYDCYQHYVAAMARE